MVVPADPPPGADATGEAFLGLTMGCARCHDHEYDPIRRSDDFAMQPIFAARFYY